MGNATKNKICDWEICSYSEKEIIDLFDVIQSLQYLDEGVNREFKDEENISFFYDEKYSESIYYDILTTLIV